MRTQSPEGRAKRRNSAIARRNQKIVDRYPLFAATGVLDQVVALDSQVWDAQKVVYDDIARGIETYERYLRWEKRDNLQYAAYWVMLCEAITEENAEEVQADYDQRWPKGHSMQQMSYRISYLNTYLARYLQRTPISVYEEATARAAAMAEGGKRV